MEADEAAGLIRASTSGFLDLEEIRDFRRDMTALVNRVRRRQGHFLLLVDLRESMVLSLDVMVEVGQQMQWNIDNGMNRSATLVSSVLQRMQIDRTSERDSRFRCFLDEAEAEVWLVSEANVSPPV